MVLINILTRTGTRERQYNILCKSIESQTFKNIRHIKSCDNPNCTFLDFENDINNIVKVNPEKNKGIAFYNLYLNELANAVNEGWVIILDDDSKLVDNQFLEKLNEYIIKAHENDILIYKSMISPKKRTLPPDAHFKNKIFKDCHIDMACFCLHHTSLKTFEFDAERMADYRLLDYLRGQIQYNFKYVDINPGIWANYEGQKLGKN